MTDQSPAYHFAVIGRALAVIDVADQDAMAGRTQCRCGLRADDVDGECERIASQQINDWIAQVARD